MNTYLVVVTNHRTKQQCLWTGIQARTGADACEVTLRRAWLAGERGRMTAAIHSFVFSPDYYEDLDD